MEFKPERNRGKTLVAEPKYQKYIEVNEKTIPIVDYPVVPVTPKDPKYWKKDNAVKEAKKRMSNSQMDDNYLIESYAANLKRMKADIHVRVGRQRL